MLAILTAIDALPEPAARAFMKQLWLDHRAYMFFTARRYLRNATALEDVVSESLLRLMDRTDTLMGLSEAQLRAYVGRTVRSQAINHLRRAGREVGPVDDVPADPEDAPWRRIELEAELELLRDAVARLPERQRQAVRLRYGKKLDMKAVAAELKVSVSTARTDIAQARARLRQMLYSDGEEGWQ